MKKLFILLMLIPGFAVLSQNKALMKLLETRSKPKKRIPLADARMQLGLNKPAAT